MKILVTGASGFVGSALVSKLSEGSTKQITAATRKLKSNFKKTVAVFPVGEFFELVDWKNSLTGVDVVIHCAARVHVMREFSSNPLAEFRRINAVGSLRLAEQAAIGGVKRFIFISSIKVNGAATKLGAAFYADDTPAPRDPYAISKWEAEQGLHEISVKYGMELVIIRPPLVYGPGVKENFAALVKLARYKIPLPLGSVNNKRSFVYLDNLVDFIVLCAEHPLAANQTFLVSDGEDVSTTELLCRLRKILQRPARLLPVPVFFLRMVASLFGRRDMATRLCESLQLDVKKNREILGWKPPFTLNEGLQKTLGGTKV